MFFLADKNVTSSDVRRKTFGFALQGFICLSLKKTLLFLKWSPFLTWNMETILKGIKRELLPVGMRLYLYQNYVNRIQCNPPTDFVQLLNCITWRIWQKLRDFHPNPASFLWLRAVTSLILKSNLSKARCLRDCVKSCHLSTLCTATPADLFSPLGSSLYWEVLHQPCLLPLAGCRHQLRSLF